MKNVLLLVLGVFATACAVQKSAAVPSALGGSESRQQVDAKGVVERLQIPELGLCLLEGGPLVPANMGRASPPCVSRISFKPIGIEPERTKGELGVILRLSPADQEKLSAFCRSFPKRSAVLIRDGIAIRNFTIAGPGATDLHVTFENDSQSDLFFRALFGK